MAAIIQTAHRVVGLFGTDPYGSSMDGFASGNYMGGVLPTELSAAWCNSVQQEINNACISGLGFALDSSSYTQLSYSIDAQIEKRSPKWTFSPIFKMRTQSDAALSASGLNNVRHQRTNHAPSLAAGSVNSTIVMPTITNSQALITFRVSCVQTDLITNYGNAEWRASIRNSAGVVTIQNSAAGYSDISLAGLVFSVVVVGANVVLRTTIPAAPAGKFHNVFGYGEMNCVLMTP